MSAALPTGEATALARLLARPAHAVGSGAGAASVTLGWRALLKIKHVPFQLFDVTAMPIMFTLLFTYLFGGAIAGAPETYLQHLLPGIVVQTIIFITVYTGVGLATDIQKGIHDRFRSLPMWQPAPIVGALLGDLLRFTMAALVVIVVGVLLGFRPGGGPLGVLLGLGLVLVFAFSLSWMWMIVGMKVSTPESVMTTSFLFLFPLTFVTNIFVPTHTMPAWLQGIVNLNPVTHLATATRGLMHGDAAGVAGNVTWVLLAAAVLTAVFAPVAMRMYSQER